MQYDILKRDGLKDGLVQRPEVNRPCKLLRTPLLPRLRTSVQVLQTDVVPKAADDIESQGFGPGDESLLGKEGVRDKAAGQLQKVILERVYGPQVNANDGIVVVHMLEIVRNGASYFVSKGLLGHKMNSGPGIGVNEGEAHQLESPLDRGSASRPEVSHAGSLLPGLADMARVYGYCPAVWFAFPDQCPVERYPVKLLPEVHTETLFGRVPEPPHLKEVDAIWYGQKKFHGFDEERTKRFA